MAVTVNEAEPEAVGVPESKPPCDNVSPAGKLPPVIPKVTGAAPPVAVIVVAYAAPIAAFGSEVVVIVRLALIEMVKLAEVLMPFESVPDKEKLNVPAAVGVPETTVPPPVKERPPGSEPDASNALEMAPVKTNGCEYGLPTIPPGIAMAMAGTGETW